MSGIKEIFEAKPVIPSVGKQMKLKPLKNQCLTHISAPKRKSSPIEVGPTVRLITC